MKLQNTSNRMDSAGLNIQTTPGPSLSKKGNNGKHEFCFSKFNISHKLLYLVLILASSCLGERSTQNSSNQAQPNLIIIQTDEHNLRTLGAYRETLSEEQAFMWGKGVFVSTPNIDALAHEGALCTRFYAVSPVCTPSRASLVSGLYPIATGSYKNDLPLNDGLVTFAEVLKREGYATSYVGKWHLDGTAKPGFAPARKFGFEDNRYMFNRGHWKILVETAEGPEVAGSYNQKTGRYHFNMEESTDKSFTTDFLVDRGLEIIERDKGQPFCLMLSLPDPHGPNRVRAPYDSMFTHLKFEQPRSMLASAENRPLWNPIDKNVDRQFNQIGMAQIFGMVKCIDDNVGKIMNYLKANGLDQNTIIVFTSDHGDLMGEHARHNKGLPYETSARIPFIIRYPGKIEAGKLIHKAYTTTDFAPTILSMMGVSGKLPDFHGEDASADFLSSAKQVNDDRIVYLTNAANRWVAAVNSHYKLVLSITDKPWLYDLEKDPDELINFYQDPAYAEVASRFKIRLMELMEEYDEPALENGNLIYE